MRSMNQRGHASARLDPGAFRCLVCKTYVTGTPSGHCPRCGFVPPAVSAIVEPSRTTPWTALAVIAALAAAIALAQVL
jgi:hypothetical protein